MSSTNNGNFLTQVATSVIFSIICLIITAIVTGIIIIRDAASPWLLSIMIILQIITVVGLIYLFTTGKWRKHHTTN